MQNFESDFAKCEIRNGIWEIRFDLGNTQLNCFSATVDLSLAALGAKWLVEMVDYLRMNPDIIVNGFIQRGIAGALDAHMHGTGGRGTRVRPRDGLRERIGEERSEQACWKKSTVTFLNTLGTCNNFSASYISYQCSMIIIHLLM